MTELTEVSRVAIDKLANKIGEFILKVKSDGVLYISVTSDGLVLFNGDPEFIVALQKISPVEMGMTDPNLPRNVTLTLTLENGRGNANVGAFAPHLHGLEPPALNLAVDDLVGAVTDLFSNTSITFHEDGSVTGVGMGRHLAKSLRRATPGDGVYEILNNPDLKRPLHLVMVRNDWSWFDHDGQKLGKTLH